MNKKKKRVNLQMKKAKSRTRLFKLKFCSSLNLNLEKPCSCLDGRFVMLSFESVNRLDDFLAFQQFDTGIVEPKRAELKLHANMRSLFCCSFVFFFCFVLFDADFELLDLESRVLDVFVFIN